MERKHVTIKNALAVFVTALLLLLSVWIFCTPVSVPASAAEGGPSWWSPNGNYAFDIAMDVNGRDCVTADIDNFSLNVAGFDFANANTVPNNNSKALRTRRISLDALMAGYVKVQDTDMNELLERAGHLSYLTSLNYSLSAVDNQYKNVVTSTIEESATEAYLVLTALGYKQPAYLRVTATKKTSNTIPADLPQTIDIYLRVNIGSTFAPVTQNNLEGIDNDRTIYIKDDSPLQLVNGQTEVYDISDLVDKTLYYVKDGKNVDIQTPGDDPKSWVLHDVAYLPVTRVSGVSAGSGSGGVPQTIVRADSCTVTAIDVADIGNATPNIIIDVDFNESTVRKVNASLGENAFWNNIHYLFFTVRVNASESTTMTVRIGKAVRMLPTGAPRAKNANDMSIVTDLNVSSEFEYRVGDTDYINEHAADGFGSVIVIPSYIADYPSDGRQYFENVPIEYEGGAVSVTWVDNVYQDGVQADGTTPRMFGGWKVTALAVGNPIIPFVVSYTTATGTIAETVTVNVTFNVYGGYDITLDPIQGKKVHSYRTTTASEFADLFNDKYFMTGATVTEGDAADVDLNSGILTVRPKTNGTIKLKFDFANLNGKKVVVYTDLRIDYDANGFFVIFDDWQAWLIIAAAIVVGLALILLIVWLFIRGISKRRQAELETTAPTSSYIIKLNSTIAAAQTQQRMATQAFSNAQTQMLQLGGGVSSAAGATSQAGGNTLQLSAGATSMPAGVNVPPPTTEPSISEPAPQPSAADDIAIPLSDDELLERIFVEKYEPRGMVRRTFFKSKDLQTRELEKEKARIREEVRNGTPIEEAIMSKAQREALGATSAPAEPTQEAVEEITVVGLLGFDPASPLLPAEEPFTPAEDAALEQVKLQTAERALERLNAELAATNERLEKASRVTEEQTASADEDEKSLTNKREYADGLKEELTQLEIKLASAKSKEKEKISKDIEIKERVQKETLAAADKLATELDAKRTRNEELQRITEKLTADKEALGKRIEEATATVEDAKKDYDLHLERVEMAQKAQAKRESIDELTPMLEKVNALDKELRDLENQIDKDVKDKDTFKTEVTTIQSQLLTTTDVTVIGNLSERISELNKAAANLDKAISASKKTQADKNIEFTKERKRANEYIERKELAVEDVIAAEDEVIGKMALEEMLSATTAEQTQAEADVAKYQSMVDEFLELGDSKVLELAVKTSEEIKAAEDELAQAQAELAELDGRMENASDDEKLMLSIDQMSLNERVEELKKNVEEVTAAATKEKLEFQMNRENELEELRAQLSSAQEAYAQATERLNKLTNDTQPTDLIISGSGVISQDQQLLEKENLKKQLQQTKDILEQANIQAKVAQMEAERKIIEAQKASDASKEEAERVAQEAMAAAEEAKRAAEQRAEEEANRVREEAERAMREAEEAAEAARRAVEEEAERVRQEAEEARRAAEEEAERARQEAEQARKEAEEAAERARVEAEEAKRAAEEEAERARQEAEAAAEKARQEAEEAAERARVEAEEAKRAAEEEAERARKEAEEKAEQERKEAEERAEQERKEAEEKAEKERKEKEEAEARIAEKVNKRKAQILELRNELKTVTDEQTAKDLREKFYAMQMTLDEDEKTSGELKDLLTKSMEDATHAGEMAVLRAQANKAPRRIVKKVTERVNRVPKKKPGARPAGARPGGTRPNGARPTGTKPAGARTNGARPAPRPGARPGGARPNGARPTGARPAPRPGARPGGTRPNRPSGK